MVKTAVGANSQATAATGPPSRTRAAAASAEQTADTTTPVSATGMPELSPSAQQRRQSGEERHQGAVGPPR